MTVRGIFYDMDGTLIDSLPGIESAARQAWNHVLPGQDMPDIRSVIGPPIRSTFELMGGGEHCLALESAFRTAYDGGCFRESVPFESVSETVAHLHQAGIRQWIVTNKPAAPAKLILESLGLSSFFEEVVSPDSREPRFSNKGEALAEVFSRSALHHSEALFVGDTVEDWEAATHVGIGFLGVPHGYGYRELESSGAVLLKTFGDLRERWVPIIAG